MAKASQKGAITLQTQKEQTRPGYSAQGAHTR